MENLPIRFNIRVYGILRNPEGAYLVTDEFRSGYWMTKFPGGGLELGEGLHACLVREFQEETGVFIQPEGIFYANEFFQVSAFNPRDQILSLYYWVHSSDWMHIPIEPRRMDIQETADRQYFRWVAPEDLATDSFTFPIDREVVKKLSQLKLD